MLRLHLDIETYSSVDLMKSGVYKYIESPDFEILMLGYAFDARPVKMLDIKQGDKIPDFLKSAMLNPEVTKVAHQALFERLCLSKSGYRIPPNQWECNLVKVAYCGLPLSLEKSSEVINGESKQKDLAGKALIRYFCTPCKPTKVNGGRTRNLPHHAPEKWKAFLNYCAQDVEAERASDHALARYQLPEFERKIYFLDQKINDRGVKVDLHLVNKATQLDEENTKLCIGRMKEITGLDNPNSVPQLKSWLVPRMSETIENMTKEDVEYLHSVADTKAVREVLALRLITSKASIKKYQAILIALVNSRVYGLFQFYGANRTGRWAGRQVQLHNLVRNNIKNLETVREAVKKYDLDPIKILHGGVSSLLSQLIRTAFIASEGNILAVADFSAIEARVAAWLATEQWRVDVFNGHGKIYEASAASMFGVDISQVTKDSEYRQKGKIAELALAYQGGVGALVQMGAAEMDLSEEEMKDIIKRWRKASPSIASLWKELEGAAKKAVKRKGQKFTVADGKLGFISDGAFLMVCLPSGRKLFYAGPLIKPKLVRRPDGETFNTESITYMGVHQKTRKWSRLDTYGGKLFENACQAIARDILAESMVRVDENGYDIVMHVHDEIVCEVPLADPEQSLDRICELMSVSPEWAKDLYLTVDGYVTPFYKKD